MFSAHIKTVTTTLLTLATVLATCVPVSAGIFNVKPIRLYLNKETASAVLTVENQDTTPLRLQLSGLAWSDDRNGQPQFKPTDDLIVFPTLITMNPLETRNIRIGFSGTSLFNREIAYRVMLDELPSLQSQIGRVNTPGVAVRTRITVPIFIVPTVPMPKAQIDRVALHRSSVDAQFTNVGNVHVVAQTAEIVGQGANGAQLFSKTISGWYVLAGETRIFHTSIARTLCSRLKIVSVTIKTDIGSFTSRVPAAASDCD